jgi:hypothetical protein
MAPPFTLTSIRSLLRPTKANMNSSLTVISILAVGSAAMAQQSPDELKQRVLTQAQSRSADDYGFTRTIRIDSVSNGKTEKKVSVEKYDPTKPAAARWTLISVDRAAPSADALNTFRKEAAKRRVVPGYHRLANYFGAPATASTDPRGRTLFRFPALPKGSVSVFDTDVSQNSSAEVSVTEANGTPFAEQVHISVKPMRLKLLMKLDHFESTARYRIGPEGKPLLAESISEMSGSGMGQEGTIKTVSTYSDYRPVGGQH